MDETLDKFGEMIAGALPGSVTGHRVAHGELTVSAIASDIVKVATFLRDDERCQFWSITDVTAVDWPGRERRFDVVYHFLSPKQNQRVRVKIEVDETTPVPSIIGVFPGANWFERETYDLYGVLFTGHPDMRRLLTDYGFGAIRCARIFHSPGSSSCATTTSRSASCTNRCGFRRNSATSISFRRGKVRATCCRATRRRATGRGAEMAFVPLFPIRTSPARTSHCHG